MQPMLKCGHQANATKSDGTPCCAICAGLHFGYDEVDDSFDWYKTLKNRKSRCCNKSIRPSIEALNGKLAFFEYRGKGSYHSISSRKCLNCGKNQGFHETRKQYLERGKKLHPGLEQTCNNYKPGEEKPEEFDLHYCGCRGWD